MADPITYDDFAKVELRVAKVLEARPHPNADKLMLLQIDVGDAQKQIVAGIRQHYTPEQLVGKMIVVVNNLAPAMLRGETSNGMLLAATSGEKVIVLTVDDPDVRGRGQDQVKDELHHKGTKGTKGVTTDPVVCFVSVVVPFDVFVVDLEFSTRGGVACVGTSAISRPRRPWSPRCSTCSGRSACAGRGCWSRPAAGATSSPGLLGAAAAAARDPGHRDPGGARRGRPRGRRRRPVRGWRSSGRASSTSTSAATCAGTSAGRSWSSATPPGSPTPRWACSRAATCRARGTSRGSGGSTRGPAPRTSTSPRPSGSSCSTSWPTRQPTIALLCKTSVARNVLEFARRDGAAGRRGVAVADRRREAGSGRRSMRACSASRSGRAAGVERRARLRRPGRDRARVRDGVRRGRLVADLDAYEALRVRRRDLPAHLAARTEARRRRRDGADRD